MRFIFHNVFLLGFFTGYFSLYQCCLLLYYTDLRLIYDVSICKSNEIFCSYFSDTSTSIQNITNVFGLLKPREFGQIVEDLNSLGSGQVILFLFAKEDFPNVFVIEATNKSNQKLNILVLTNETSFTTNNDLDEQFQCLNLTLLPESLKRIKLRKSPFSYNLIRELFNVTSYFKNHTVAFPESYLSANPSALFDENCTFLLIPSNPNATKAEASAIMFTTPTHFNLTLAIFNVCAPGPPLNVSAHWNSKEVTVTWLPPKYTSSNILGYNISIFSDSMVFINYLLVDKDTLKVSFAHLDFFTNYVFAVRAISERGLGLPAVAEIIVKELKALGSVYLPYHYLVPFLLILLVIVFVILTKVHRETFKKGYPSGVADVDDHIRPFLISPERIHLREILGQGAFGIVHRGIYTRSKSKEEVAVKVFPAETNTRHQLLHEVEMMRIVGRHDQIVGLHGISLDVDKMYLILEYCPLGDLHSYLVNLKPQVLRLKRLVKEKEYYMSEKDRGHGKRLCSYIYQVALGMEYIASLRLVHRDLAARNVLMLNEKRVKIADFGLSKDVYETEVYSCCKQQKLPLKWMAPESIEKQKFTTFTDVWSFGVLMWEVFKLGKVPYPGLTNSRLLEYLKLGYRLEKPHCNQEWYNLMLKCWRQNQRERPQFKQLVKQIGVMIDRMCIYVSVV